MREERNKINRDKRTMPDTSGTKNIAKRFHEEMKGGMINMVHYSGLQGDYYILHSSDVASKNTTVVKPERKTIDQYNLPFKELLDIPLGFIAKTAAVAAIKIFS